MNYEPRTFGIPALTGISQKSVDDHLGLYQGYVKNFNAISELLREYTQDSGKHAHALSELLRRRSFEFGGMRLHELYFEQLEGRQSALASQSPLSLALIQEYGSLEQFLAMFKAIGLMRGPGWALLYYDPVGKTLLTGFSGEQHQGHFATLPVILALDVWEHAYLLDYGVQGKGGYIDAFLSQINWQIVADRFERAQR
jgi:Fe-Mn family superoxide dismutase